MTAMAVIWSNSRVWMDMLCMSFNRSWRPGTKAFCLIKLSLEKGRYRWWVLAVSRL